jgi:chromosome partitioning protein
MYDVRTNLSKQVVSEVKSYFKDKVYNTIIPRNVRLGESPSFGKPIILYDPDAKGAKAYVGLALELINQNMPQEQEVVDNAAEIVG